MKKLICFSLWGVHDIYNKGAIANVQEAKEVYPGWICRFYIDEKSPVLTTLQKLECEVIPMKLENSWIPLYWRFYAASDPDTEYALFRDCDSRVNTREAAAVAEWVKSGKNVHLMKDWPAPHATETILAGMWGIKGGVVTNMKELIREWISHDNVNNKYTDQDFLRKKLWPMIKDSVLNHGVNSPSGEAIPFPPHAPMKGMEYVGQPIQV